jgi:23S rRNA G2445 N2-methylase RlmL
MMNFETPKSKLLITCAPGIAPYLEHELQVRGFPVFAVMNLGIFSEGTLLDAVSLNLQLRTGLRVLYLLKEFQAETPDELYRQIRLLPWQAILPVDGYVSVTSAVSTAAIQDSRFANLKCKDAIVDAMQEKMGRRPDSGPERSRSVVFLYWKDSDASIFIDTSGEPLSRRGYRKIPFKAPMQETLAAAVLLAAGWSGEGNFINPMCGSGTLAIEAALIALDKAPGLLRNNFGFMHIAGYDATAYQEIRQRLRAKAEKTIKGRIIVSDDNPEAVAAARQNAKTAGIDHLLEFEVCDFRRTVIPEGEGIIMLNPPYGLRLGQIKPLESMYKAIGDFFKQQGQGYRGYIFTGNLALAKKVGLKTSRRLVFYNGAIESRLLEYILYAGSMKKQLPEDFRSDSSVDAEEIN